MVEFEYDIAIVGGCGHVGLPLGIAFADRGLNVALYDLNAETVAKVHSGVMPFMEEGADEVLARVIGTKLHASTDADVVSKAKNVVVVVGTPIDDHLNPDPYAVPDAVGALLPHLRDGQLLILRSTVFPGVTRLVERTVADSGKLIDVAFCPERIAEGKAMIELYELPQIVSARDRAVMDRAIELFMALGVQIVELDPEEAELAKLFTNTWRYMKFAVANQLFMLADNFGLDYEHIRQALSEGYPRAKDLPSAGFAAGPCLLKDTMQLASYNNNDFELGQAAMNVNERLPLHVAAKMRRNYDLPNMTVGILGMAFKAESDDTRSSLSYKLRRALKYSSKAVLCADPYVTTDPKLVSEEEVLARADILVIGAPHKRYAGLSTSLPIVDIWQITPTGVRV